MRPSWHFFKCHRPAKISSRTAPEFQFHSRIHSSKHYARQALCLGARSCATEELNFSIFVEERFPGAITIGTPFGFHYLNTPAPFAFRTGLRNNHHAPNSSAERTFSIHRVFTVRTIYDLNVSTQIRLDFDYFTITRPIYTGGSFWMERRRFPLKQRTIFFSGLFA